MAIRPLFDVIDEINVRMNHNIKSSVENHRRIAAITIKAVEQNRQAFALLNAAGFDINVGNWEDGSEFTLDLGYFANNKKDNRKLAEQVRKVRMALDCHLNNEGKSLSDASKRLVRYNLQPVDFPGIRVVFRRKLPAGAKKCRIVTSRSSYKSLVCEA